MQSVIKLLGQEFRIFTEPFFEGCFCDAEGQNSDGNYVVLSSFNSFETINLDSEILGESVMLGRLALESGKHQGVVFCGVTTQIMGLKHISVAVCSKGKLIDIVDRTVNIGFDEYESSNKIKIFATDFGRFALLVDTDCAIEKNWEKTAPFCDCVICILKNSDENILNSARAFSTKQNCPYILLTNEGAEWKD